MLKVENLRVSSDGKEIIQELNFEAGESQVHVIMGPNGSGKSTFSKTLAGHPEYANYEGSIKLNGQEISSLTPGERLQEGLMLGFQYPPKIEGVKIRRFLEKILEKHEGYEESEAREEAIGNARRAVNFSEPQLERSINDGFSGGERKRMELLQARLIEPEVLILDEPDSGIDVDSLNLIANQINYLKDLGATIILITHYGDTLDELDLEKVKIHLFKEGKIVTSGPSSLAGKVEEKGFNQIYEECDCN